MKNGKWKILILLFITNLFALNLPEYFSADFTQKIYSDNSILTYKGKIFTDSKKVFWKYTYPNEKEIWISNKVYVYEPDLLQVTISKKPEFNLFDALKNAKKIKNNDYIANVNDKKIHFLYDNTLKKAWYTDDVGNKVEITFSNQSKKKINSSTFNPKFPEDVDFIYQN
jgi:outer membrane lipoprotein carrier protein